MKTEYDYIVAGGGTAGCIVAARLTEDPNISVLVLERGKTNKDDELSNRPANYLRCLATERVHNHFCEPSEDNDNKKVIVPQGNILGGGSSVNFMMYTRPSGTDFDDWGMKGWAFDDVLPYFKRMETYHGDNDADSKDVHGYEGPLQVSAGHRYVDGMNSFFDASKKVLENYQDVADSQDFKSVGAHPWMKWIDPKTGKRSGAADAYIHANAHRENLVVMCETKVNKINMHGNTATGVEAIVNGEVVNFTASREVIVSAGAFGSPKLLELSGIGRRDILEKAGIQPIVENDGVGENYQDHLLFLCMYHVSKDAETHDALLRKEEPNFSKAEEDFKSAKGEYATNSIDGSMKWRPSDSEVEGTGFEKLWADKFQSRPEKPLMLYASITGNVGDFALVPPGKYYAVGGYLEYPEGRGSLHITSSDPSADPKLEGFYVNHIDDINVLRYAYKKCREIARTMPEYRGEFAPSHPPFSETGSARIDPISVETARENTQAPAGIAGTGWTAGMSAALPEDKPNGPITYDDEDEKVLEKWLKGNCGTTWHPMGTNAMAPRIPSKSSSAPNHITPGVVDERLRVYGTKNLRVCDLSVCPIEPGCNTCAMAYVIGERGSDLIKEDQKVLEEGKGGVVNISVAAVSA